MSTMRQPLKIVISSALGIAALLLLITNLPDQVSGILIFYGLMIALTLNFNAFIPDLELNPAHGIGMMLLLSLPLASLPASLWTITLGTIAGEAVCVLRSKRPLVSAHTLFVVAQMTISFYLSAQLYNSALPLSDLVDGSVSAVVVYGLAYSTLFFLFFLFEMALDGKSFRLLRAYVPELLLVLLLPIPLAALGTLIITRLSLLAFAIYAISLILILLRQMEITRLQRRQIEELHSIGEMSKAISANLDLDALLAVVYSQVNTLLNVSSITVAIYDGTKLQFPLNLRDGMTLPETDQDEVKTTLINRVLQNQQPQRFTESDGRSWLGVPLLSGGHLLGALVITDARHFNDDALRQLNIIASTTGVALENTQFYRQQKERLTQLATLNSIVALLTDTLSPDTVIDTIISSASTIAEASAVAVYLFGEDSTPSLTLARCAGLSETFVESPPDPLIEGADQPGASPQPVVITNAARDPRAAALRDLMQHEGKAAWIELPLSLQGVPIGLLVIYYNQAHEFDPEIIELLRTFANQCAQAISNARLYAITDEALEQRVGQLLALANIGHHLTAALEVRAICDLVADYARKTTNSRACAVLLLNSTGDVEYWSASGYPPETFSINRRPSENGAIARSIQLKDTVLVNDSEKAALSVAHLPGTRSQIAAPLLWNESVTGVILLDSAKPNAFSEEDSYFVNQLANQAVIAIENARLFRKVSEARDRMQVILNTVKEGLILISTEGEVILANPRVALMGLQPETLIGKTLAELLEQDDLGLAERLGFRTGGELLRVVNELRAPNGLAAREPNAYTVEDEDSVVHVEQQIFPVSDETDRPLG
ncbi:MAG: GAF domain-containing protein, partial [Chloroflexi bacterium]|nr:GAF domain-containing protein [Chloroflexota bacterium]